MSENVLVDVDLATTVTVLDAAGRAGVPVLLSSDPGMGKSSLVRQVAHSEGLICETVLGSIREPADVGGLPVVTGTGVRLEAPAWAKRLAEAEGGVLFLDELTTSPPAVQAAMLAVALDRTVGDLRLPESVRVVAGANPPDRAADGWELAAPLANRFLHLGYEPTADEWTAGMMGGWSAPPASRAVAAEDSRRSAWVGSVTGFIRTRPDLLHAFPDAASTGGPWPSRRVWDMLTRVLSHVRSDDTATLRAAVCGLVGIGAGTEFLTWHTNADLPDPAQVVADPSIVAWGDRPDRVWAVLSGVAAWAAGKGTATAWREAWGPLIAASEHGTHDVAAVAARALQRVRPPKASVPAAARTAFLPVLAAAGMAAASEGAA